MILKLKNKRFRLFYLLLAFFNFMGTHFALSNTESIKHRNKSEHNTQLNIDNNKNTNKDLNKNKNKNEYKKAVILTYMDAGGSHPHELKMNKIFRKNLHSCRGCKLISFPLFEKDGALDPDKITKKVLQLKGKTQLLHLSWNLPYDASFANFVSALDELSDSGVIIVGASGDSQSGGRTANDEDQGLSKPGVNVNHTVLGKVKRIILISELDEMDRLPLTAHYGEKILAGYKPPKGYSGSSFSSILFTATLAKNFYRRTSTEWHDHFTRIKSLKPKPTLEDFFN